MHCIRLTCALVFASVALQAVSQAHSHIHTRAVIFPNVPDYRVLRADLHIHTVFSDGNVWPTIRVEEAIRDSLDVIAITDHIEYLPHREDIPPVDRNRSYEVALRAARNSDLLVVRGVELTRGLPPGHSNALFLTDANPFVVDDHMAQFEEAGEQGAFVFWNHPSWEGQQKNTIATLTDLHKDLIDGGLLHGIEVANGDMYSEHALQIALENDLTIMGVSDIHGLVDWDYDVENGGHRPVTLVFARERSLESLQEALFEGRTVVYYKDFLIGREEHVVPLLYQVVGVEGARYADNADVVELTLSNNSSANLILVNRSQYGLHTDGDIVMIPHLGNETILVQTGNVVDELELEFQVMNAITAPREHPTITLTVRIESD